jgi:dihydroxyacid dehydratase/phosphogluconate dehydratase
MYDSLPYGNDAAPVFGRLIRSLPTRRGVIGVATCDKGLPANRQTPRIGFVLLLRSLL